MSSFILVQRRERFSWIRGGETKLEEDKAYSMLGIFDVSMPVLYGEGRNKAESWLRDEIRKLDYEHVEPAQPTKKELLEFLSFDQIGDRCLNIKPRHSKTCGWLLQSMAYMDWLNPDIFHENHGFFWIKKKPGSGKSTLTICFHGD